MFCKKRHSRIDIYETALQRNAAGRRYRVWDSKQDYFFLNAHHVASPQLPVPSGA
jgi:hypothetical protein